MTEIILSGRCLCGNIVFKTVGDCISSCICHCRSCRLASGSPFVAWTTVYLSQFEISKGTPKTFQSSPGVIRSFCRDCGSTFTYANDQYKDKLDICTALFDQCGDVAPEYHIWTSEKLPWIRLDDGLPVYPEWRKDA